MFIILEDSTRQKKLVEAAAKRKIPIFVTEDNFKASSNCHKLLRRGESAGALFGTMYYSMYLIGLLITGESGVGKI